MNHRSDDYYDYYASLLEFCQQNNDETINETRSLSYPFHERLLQYRLQCCQFKISMFCYVIKHFSNYDHNKEELNVVPFLSLLLGAKWKYGETGAAGI